MSAYGEGRLRRLYVNPSLILVILNWCNMPEGSCISFPKDLNLPEDADVVSVDYEHHRRSFCFILAHPSFDVVPEGGVIPEHGEYWNREMGVLQKPLVKGRYEPPTNPCDLQSSTWRDRPQMF